MMMNYIIKLIIPFLIFVLIPRPDLQAEDFYIIYTSNINGTIENCGCGSEPLGGLGRIKSVIEQFKKEHENVFLIDGGDYFNSYPYPALNQAMYKAMILLDYDCVVPGDQAFVEGKKFYNEYVSGMKDKIILSNDGPEYKRKIKTIIGSNHLEIYAFLSPDVFDFIKKPEYLKLSNIADVKLERSTDSIFRIAIIHGKFDTAEQFASENSSLDLVLLAHDQQKGIWNTNRTMIIGNGKDSEYISIIQIKKGTPWEITVNQKKISEEISEDEQISKLIDEYKKN